MGEDPRYDKMVELISSGRQSTDGWRITVGLRLSQMQRIYGEGLVDRIAPDVNLARSTLYEYCAVARFLVQWLGLSARRTFQLYPYLTYSHIRLALRFFVDLEDQIDALLCAGMGDNLRPEFIPPMSVDGFQTYLLARKGRPDPRKALVHLKVVAGSALSRILPQYEEKYRGRLVEVIIREAKR